MRSVRGRIRLRVFKIVVWAFFCVTYFQEFIDIFTEDNLDVKTLKDIVALTDLDEQVEAAAANGNQV